MSEKGYNGWKNFETLCVALWIDNDEGLHNRRNEMCDEIRKEHTEEDDEGNETVDRDTATYALSKRLKDWLEEMQDEDLPGASGTLWADLLGAALSEVDWQEIAENWIDEE